VRDGGKDRELGHGLSLLKLGHDGYRVGAENQRAQDKSRVTTPRLAGSLRGVLGGRDPYRSRTCVPRRVEVGRMPSRGDGVEIQVRAMVGWLPKRGSQMERRDVATDSVPSTKLNLYDLARANGGNMRGRYEALLVELGEKAEGVRQFCAQVERDGHASINAKGRRFLFMLRNGYYPNPYDEARLRAANEGGDMEEYLKQQQGLYYPRRVAFDRSFVDGENFRYAALNIGGAGLIYYGRYCLVISDPSEGDPVALLPANSLKRFTNDAAELDREGLQREAVPWSHRHHLTACKHAQDVTVTPEFDWPQMMCHAKEDVESFVEIIVGSPVTPRRMSEIRVDQSVEARLIELVASAVAGTLTEAERAEVGEYLEVLDELRNRGLDGLYQAV